jgi:hypothetical protein
MKVWVKLLAEDLKYLNLSSADFDGSNMFAQNRGDILGGVRDEWCVMPPVFYSFQKVKVLCQ